LNIVRSRYLELAPARRELLDAAAHAEFEQYAIVRETEWSIADWTFQALEGDTCVSYYNIVERTVSIDGVATRAAGLNNVVTIREHRGRGAASALLRQTQPSWFEELHAECGLLLCADGLLPFYARLGWQKVSGRVVYSQPDGIRTWAESCMLLDPSRRWASAREIDLCGLPW
jgi:aminoglycoside 2'-N-acetyltransferase I